ncbi:PTS sugar transporter subunit IIA [Vagococcus vulneris]|uniref:PTS mannose transporter subunit IIAB n=1 Tax=Vagococcus vulneris TaxID=1977869 RepID=A0A429ZYY3_9ENTE|nr:fructose PTS transporter subunit IIA [Vagococcus vulneris]RST99168.1 PTS mannose transporter subunit IIAB [Vagococcus vulneris]
MVSTNKVNKENIILDLEASTKDEVIKKIAIQLNKNGYLSNLNTFIDDVHDREDHMTTGIGDGLAIPHGKSDAVLESTVAVARLKKPVDWDSLDDKPVEFIFLLAIKNKDQGDEHLRILADLSGKLMDDNFVERIKQSKTEEELFDALAF